MAELNIRTKSFADFPERGLWAAIVADAIDICLGRTFAPITEQIAARRWMLSPRTGVGGFLWCCHLLGLDETAVREQVARAAGRSFPWSLARRPLRAEPLGERWPHVSVSARS